MRPICRLSVLAVLTGGLVILCGGPPRVLAQKGDKPVTVKVGVMKATAPAGWQSEKPKYTLRSYQFKLPGSDEGTFGELIVSPESDPKTQKVFPRWKTQFVLPEGKTADDISKVTKIDGVKGLTITLLDVSGTWRHKERPFDPKSPTMMLENWRVVWAVVTETAENGESTHIRLSGPKATVDKYYPGFETFLKSLK